jgi:hypothetical protein
MFFITFDFCHNQDFFIWLDFFLWHVNCKKEFHCDVSIQAYDVLRSNSTPLPSFFLIVPPPKKQSPFYIHVIFYVYTSHMTEHMWLLKILKFQGGQSLNSFPSLLLFSVHQDHKDMLLCHLLTFQRFFSFTFLFSIHLKLVVLVMWFDVGFHFLLFGVDN